MTITEFLLARIADDEAVARAVIAIYEPYEWDNPSSGGNYFPAEVTLWDRFDPARVLAECAAKRAIIEQARQASELERECDEREWAGAGPEQVEPAIGDAILYALASVYADRPDYRQEWAA